MSMGSNPLTSALSSGNNKPKPSKVGLFVYYRTSLRKKKLRSLLGEYPKMAICHICPVLRPKNLKRKNEMISTFINNAYEMTGSHSKST